jgi:hypothetical protein
MVLKTAETEAKFRNPVSAFIRTMKGNLQGKPRPMGIFHGAGASTEEEKVLTLKGFGRRCQLDISVNSAQNHWEVYRGSYLVGEL